MPINVGELQVRASGDTSDAQRGIGGMSTGLADLQMEVRQLGGHLQMLSQALTQTAQKTQRDASDGIRRLTSEMENMRRESEASSERIKALSEELAALKAKSAAPAIEKTGDAAKRARGSLTAAGQAISALGGAAGTAGGRLASLAGSLLGTFGAGAAIGIGIGAAVSGFQALVSHIRETEQAARKLRALHEILGVTEADVNRLSSAFRLLGADVDRKVAMEILRAGREAGKTADEIAAMAGEIKLAADLTGGDLGPTAARVFAEQKTDVDDLIQKYRELAIARQASTPQAAQEREVAQAVAGIEEKRVQAANNLLQAQDNVLSKLAEIAALDREITEHRARFGDAFRKQSWEWDVPRLASELDALQAVARGAASEVEKLNEKERELRDAAAGASDELARQQAHTRLLTRLRQIRVDQEREAAERERKAAEQRRKAAAEQERLAREEERRREEIARIGEESTHRVRVLQAQAAEDRKAEINALADYEIAKAEAVAAKHVELQGAMAAQIQAINAKRAADLAAVDEQAAKEAAKNAADARKEIERSMQDKERTTQAAQVAGIQAGAAFAQGLKAGIQNNDPLAVFKGLLSAGATILGAMGSPVAGAGLSALGGLFHDGGMVGIGGRPLPRYHSGGMITAHRGIVIPKPGPGEVPIMAQAGEGVVSRRGVAAAGGPAAIRALNEGRPMPAQATAPTNIYVSAFSPRETYEMLGAALGPAQYRRGVSRADAKEIAGLRRRIRPPRSGMRT